MAKTKQKMIEGTEPERIQEVEDSAESYRAIRDKRMTLTEDEVEANANLIEVMEKHNLTTYKTEHGQVVTIVPGKKKAKVKSVDTGEEAESGNGEE